MIQGFLRYIVIINVELLLIKRDNVNNKKGNLFVRHLGIFLIFCLKMCKIIMFSIYSIIECTHLYRQFSLCDKHKKFISKYYFNVPTN